MGLLDPICPAVDLTSRPQHQGGVESDNILLRLAALALENRLQDLLIAGQITTSECINRLQHQSQGLGIELITAQLTVFQHHQLVDSRQAGLIQTAAVSYTHLTLPTICSV